MSALGRSLGSLPRGLYVLFVATLLNRAGAFVQPLLLFWLTTAKGVPIAQAGLFVSLWGAGALVAALIGGTLADRIGRKRTMLLGWGLAGLVLLGMAFAESLAVVALCVFLVPATADLSRPAMQAAVADLVPEVDRPRAYGALYWAANVGFAIAPLLAGIVADVDWRLLFVIDAASTWLCAIVVAFALPETRPAEASREGALAGLRPVLRDGPFLAHAGLGFLLAIAFYQSVGPLALAVQGAGLDAKTFGRIVAVNGLLIVLLQVPLTRWLGRFTAPVQLALGAALTGIGFGTHAFASDAMGFVVGVTIWTMGEIFVAPAGPAIVAALAPASRRGRYQGVWSLSAAAGGLVAPALGAWLWAVAGPSVLWPSVALLCFGVAAGQLVAGRARERRAGVTTAPAGSP